MGPLNIGKLINDKKLAVSKKEDNYIGKNDKPDPEDLNRIYNDDDPGSNYNPVVKNENCYMNDKDVIKQVE